MTKEWRCFHCDEAFTDEAAARAHFGFYGPRILSEPACQIDAAEYRAMEVRMADYNAEDADIHRQMASMEHEHKTALRREEEKGYARGLEAATAALLTLDKLGYTYTQGVQLWKPPLGKNPFEPGGRYAQAASDAPDPNAKCWCEKCRPITLADMRMIVCPECGDKRCPKAAHHVNECTGSAELRELVRESAFGNRPILPPRRDWIRVSDGLPVIPEGEYRTEVLTARYRGTQWVQQVAYFGGSSKGDEVRDRFYTESCDYDELGYLSICVNMIEPSHWQALLENPKDRA